MLYETTSLACTTIRLPFSCCPAPLGPLNIRPFSAHDHPTFSAAAHFSLACQFRLTHLPLDLLTLCDILIFAASGVRRPRMSSLVISLSANSVLLDLLQEFEVSLGWIFWSSLSFSNGPAPPSAQDLPWRLLFLAAALSFLTSPPLASVSCDSVCKLSTWSNALRWNAAHRGSLDNSIFLWCLPWLALGRHR